MEKGIFVFWDENEEVDLKQKSHICELKAVETSGVVCKCGKVFDDFHPSGEK